MSAASSPRATVGGRFRFAGPMMLAFWALLIAVPLLIVFLSSFKSQAQIIGNPISPPVPPSIAGYRDAAEQQIFRAFRNSVFVVAFSVSITILFASLAAFAITRISGWRGNVVFTFFTLGMAVPAQVNGIQQFALFKQLHLTNSLLGLIVVNIAVTLPVSVFILTGFMKTLPRELFEAATVDGASNLRIYRSVVMPLSMPSVAAVAIFLFVMHWNDLLYPYLFISDNAKATLPVVLAGFKGEFSTNYPAMFAGVAIASAPMIAAYVFLQRWFVAGLTSGAVKG